MRRRWWFGAAEGAAWVGVGLLGAAVLLPSLSLCLFLTGASEEVGVGSEEGADRAQVSEGGRLDGAVGVSRGRGCLSVPGVVVMALGGGAVVAGGLRG